jgi:CRISPR/Cas system-associated endonuclease Cas1
MAGVAHADNPYRDSFVYDVMELIRPDIDAWLVEFVQNLKFSVNDFYETRDGGIRLTFRLTPFLAETIPLWTNNLEGDP